MRRYCDYNHRYKYYIILFINVYGEVISVHDGHFHFACTNTVINSDMFMYHILLSLKKIVH